MRTYEGEISCLNGFRDGEFLLVGTTEGTVEVYRATMFNYTFSGHAARLSTGEIVSIVPVKLAAGRSHQFLAATSTGTIKIVEIIQGKFTIDLQITNLIENFYSNSNSISVKTSKTKGIIIAVLLNSKGFMIISLRSVVKKLHQIKLEHESVSDRSFFSLITDLSELEEDRFSMTFLV